MHRTIIITESQLRTMEKWLREDHILLDDGDMQEFANPSQIGTSAKVTDQDGNITPGKDSYADEVTKTNSFQGFMGNARSRHN